MSPEVAGLVPGARRLAWLSGETPALFRYRLDVELGLEGPPLGFLCHNSSTACHLVDDPSLVRMVGFGRRERACRVTILNPAAYRAARPAELRARFAAGGDIFGPDNWDVVDAALSSLAAERGRLVVAHGAIVGPQAFRDAMGAAIAGILAEVRRLGLATVSLGLTKGGEPRHPLYVRGSAPMAPWPSLPAAAPAPQALGEDGPVLRTTLENIADRLNSDALNIMAEGGAADPACDAMIVASDDIRAALAARSGEDDGWRPIGQASRDGTEILVWNGRRRHVALFDRVEGAWVASYKSVTRRLRVDPPPTHYRDLPAPPAPDRSAGQEG